MAPPVGPDKPMEPVGPDRPEAPVTPVIPAPVGPDKPMGPPRPVAPVTPVTPAPMGPDRPVAPCIPTPVTPVTPVAPTGPVAPVGPSGIISNTAATTAAIRFCRPLPWPVHALLKEPNPLYIGFLFAIPQRKIDREQTTLYNRKHTTCVFENTITRTRCAQPLLFYLTIYIMQHRQPICAASPET